MALVLFAIAAWLFSRAASAGARDQRRYYREAGLNRLSDEQRAALQLDAWRSLTDWRETLEDWPAAIRFSEPPAPFDTFQLVTPADAKESMDKWWGVVTTEGYRSMMERLFAGMHSVEFSVASVSEQREPMLERLAALLEIPKAKIEAKTHSTNGIPTLLWAFDLFRVIPLSRDAFLAGLVPEAEAWDNILRASRWSHAMFDNLDDFHFNLRLGHAFWSDDYAQVRERRETIEAYMARNPKWPIDTIPWTCRSPDVLPNHVRDGCQAEVTKRLGLDDTLELSDTDMH
ncbi:MAG: DUF1266 domain-containing protein [Myxococcota bacterium]